MTSGPGGASSPLRVLHVINQLTAHGGAEVSLARMIIDLQGAGVQSTVVALKTDVDGPTASRLTAAGVVVLPSLGTTGPGALPALVRTIRRSRPSVVHTSLFESDLWGRLACCVTRTPVLVSIVNTQYAAAAVAAAASPRRLELARRIDGLLARRLTSGVHAITEATAAAATRDLGVRPDHITVVPRGRDTPEQVDRSPAARRAARARTGLPLEGPVILNVARLEPQKGQVQLVEAFQGVVAVAPDARLVIAGRPGNGSAAVAGAVARHGLESRVHLLGARTDVADLLAAADVFAFSSRWEGLGGSVLEAMAHAVPLVAFDIPAVRETTGGHAQLVALDDVGAFTDALLAALSGGTAVERLADAARTRAREHFSPARVTEAMAALYGELAAGERTDSVVD